jgi:AAA domain, putative AbiEii toxin, Type IV TA system
MLKSLEIRRFRAFEQFTMGGLTRVNLLIGGNNAGKTTVMEAAELLLGRGEPWAVVRSPTRREGQAVPNVFPPRGLAPVRHLFHGHQFRPGASFEVHGGAGPEEQLRCELRPSRRDAAEPATLELPFAGDQDDEPELELVSYLAGQPVARIPLRAGGVLIDRYTRDRGEDVGAPVNFVDTRDPEARLSWMWDRVVLTPKEADVVAALQLVDDRIERLAQLSTQGNARPPIVVKRSGANEPVPLGTMGDGAKRLLVLSVNLATAAKGTLLVDEIDTGLHHTVLGAMWRLVLATARRLDVQVFASTHSLDGLRALAWALEREPELMADVSVHRIVRDQPRPVRYDAHELELAVAQDMEIR